MQARLQVPTQTTDHVQPRAYGYLRLPDSPDEPSAAVLEQAMRRFASLHDLYFVRAFHELPVGTCDGLQTLIHEMRTAEATVLLVPSLTHLAASPLLQNIYLERLEVAASAVVVTLDGVEA